jgi:hypothetical protein
MSSEHRIIYNYILRYLTQNKRIYSTMRETLLYWRTLIWHRERIHPNSVISHLITGSVNEKCDYFNSCTVFAFNSALTIAFLNNQTTVSITHCPDDSQRNSEDNLWPAPLQSRRSHENFLNLLSAEKNLFYV